MRLLLLIALALIAVNTNTSANSASASGKTAGTEPPDSIFLNGDIYTQATPARAQAMAVRDGRILAVGTNDEIRKLKGAHTHAVDLGGHFVMPGFNDAHVHLEHAGLELLSVDLRGTRSLLGWWWADPLAGLVMVPIVAREGIDALRGKACACGDGCH